MKPGEGAHGVERRTVRRAESVQEGAEAGVENTCRWGERKRLSRQGEDEKEFRLCVCLYWGGLVFVVYFESWCLCLTRGPEYCHTLVEETLLGMRGYP